MYVPDNTISTRIYYHGNYSLTLVRYLKSVFNLSFRNCSYCTTFDGMLSAHMFFPRYDKVKVEWFPSIYDIFQYKKIGNILFHENLKTLELLIYKTICIKNMKDKRIFICCRVMTISGWQNGRAAFGFWYPNLGVFTHCIDHILHWNHQTLCNNTVVLRKENRIAASYW